MKKALLINAHLKYEGFSEGKLNQFLLEFIGKELSAKGYEIRETYIEKGYDIQEEIEKHEWADLIVTQGPANWFSLPWIHKKYIDEVLTTALEQGRLCKDDGRTRKDPSKQYGTGGLMQGKKMMLSLTWNAPEAAFGNPEQFLFKGKSADDVYVHINGTYKFCGAEALPTFSIYDVVKSPSLENEFSKLKEYINMHL